VKSTGPVTVAGVTVAVVTGANQGLGFALARGLCRGLGPDGVVYLAARDRGRGEAALEQLRADGLEPRLRVLDVRDGEAVAAFAADVRTEHGGVDIVLSNAAARRSPDRPEAEQIRTFVDTNNGGTRRMIDAFGPILNDDARFVVVASAFGSLYWLPPPLHARFDTDAMSLDDVDALLARFTDQVEAGTAAADGWPEDVNIVSKIGQVASVRIMARDHGRARGILINAACPGLVDTEASRPWFESMDGAKTPDDAAVDVQWLATLPAGTQSPYGQLVQYRDVLPWQAAAWRAKFG
jgi:carbonyl reductase 1